MIKAFDKDDIVFVKGYAVAYQGGIQLNINDAARVPTARCLSGTTSLRQESA